MPVKWQQLNVAARGSMLRRQGAGPAVLPRRRHKRATRRQGGVQAESQRLRCRCGEGDLPWLHAKILSEASARIIEHRACASSLGVATIWIANAGTL